MDWGGLVHSGRVASVILAMFATGGCLYIPTDFHDVDSRENIEAFAFESIVVGTTTKEDILLQLGEPDKATSENYEYHWEKIKGILIVGGGYSAAAGGWSKKSKLLIKFDDRGSVIDRRITSDKHFEM